MDFQIKLRKTIGDLEQLLIEKNLAYGNSYEVVPAIMKILYPDGVKLEQMEDMLLIVRILDKLKRIVTNNDPFGEDAWQDLAGYGIVAMVTRQKHDLPSSAGSKPVDQLSYTKLEPHL